MPVHGDATPYIGIYTLDLFCDRQHDPRVEATFTGQTFSGCCAMAKKAGWQINRGTRTATCPTCKKRMRRRARSFGPMRYCCRPDASVSETILAFRFRPGKKIRRFVSSQENDFYFHAK